MVGVPGKEGPLLSNTHFSLAVHVLSALAYNEGELLASEKLAHSMGTNPSFLRGLVGQLREAGLVETKLGGSNFYLEKKDKSRCQGFNVENKREAEVHRFEYSCICL